MPLPEDFYDRVYAIVRQIPSGKVASYGDIARAVGAAGAARTVGYAMNASHGKGGIPAHRVVNRIGMLSGKAHFPGINAMEQMLEAEGVVIKNDQIQDFDRHHWDPVKELGIDLDDLGL